MAVLRITLVTVIHVGLRPLYFCVIWLLFRYTANVLLLLTVILGLAEAGRNMEVAA